MSIRNLASRQEVETVSHKTGGFIPSPRLLVFVRRTSRRVLSKDGGGGGGDKPRRKNATITPPAPRRRTQDYAKRTRARDGQEPEPITAPGRAGGEGRARAGERHDGGGGGGTKGGTKGAGSLIRDFRTNRLELWSSEMALQRSRHSMPWSQITSDQPDSRFAATPTRACGQTKNNNKEKGERGAGGGERGETRTGREPGGWEGGGARGKTSARAGRSNEYSRRGYRKGSRKNGVDEVSRRKCRTNRDESGRIGTNRNAKRRNGTRHDTNNIFKIIIIQKNR